MGNPMVKHRAQRPARSRGWSSGVRSLAQQLGNLAMLAAVCRASSRVSRLIAPAATLVLEVDVGERFAVGGMDHEAPRVLDHRA
jgi:hypothetical protein